MASKIYDYQFFRRRYNQIEDEFLQITDYIELQNDFESPSYKVGSSKLMDFCLKVGTEVETIFREILANKRFDTTMNIKNRREHQNIDCYREIIEPVYSLSKYEFYVNAFGKTIKPFEGFEFSTPEWFGVYSRLKHNKLELIKSWNLKLSLFALGCLLTLVINHPSSDYKSFSSNSLSKRVFDVGYSQPRFAEFPVYTANNVTYVCLGCGIRLPIGNEISVGGPPSHKCAICGKIMILER